MGKETWARRLGHDKVPGPAEYTTRGEPGAESPQYTIKKRYPDRAPEFGPPYRELPAVVGETPHDTIRPRTDDLSTFNTPGPDYKPPRFGDAYLSRRNASLSPREAIHPRRPLYESFGHDPFGPGNRDCRQRTSDVRAPAYSIAPSIDGHWFPLNDNPSGAAYRPRKAFRRAPAHPLYQIPPDQKPPDTPGPAPTRSRARSPGGRSPSARAIRRSRG
jgi:hypothetical protein